MKKNIEILAPAGSYEAMVAAVRMGADAVYLGSKALNARRNATNFDDDELLEAVKYCHERGVKVHQTLNTLMYDDEREEVENAIRTAVNVGVDALIIQDLGVLELAKTIAPDMPLHASTQMAIHNLEGVKVAQQLGFSRVVLARELSQKEIEEIAKNAEIEIEVFIHGALCMSVSGQCYLSSMIGERSGNRGLCAQPCRLPFKVEGGIDSGLSLKDLSIADKVKELAEIGVTSVKIEGRMKRPEYVAAVVSEIKKCVNDEQIDYDTLKNVFSRSGFTNGYYTSNIDYEMFGTRQKDDVLAATTVLKDLERSYSKEMPLIPIKMKLIVKNGEKIKLICSDNDNNSCEAFGAIPEVAINKPTTAEKAEQNISKTGGTPYYIEEFSAEIDEGLIVPASELNLVRRECLEKLAVMRTNFKKGRICEVVNEHKIMADMNVLPNIRIRVAKASQLTEKMLDNAELVTMPLAQLNAWVKTGGKIDDKMCGEIASIEFSTSYSRRILQQLKNDGLKHVYAANLGAIEIAKELEFEYIHCGFNLNIFNTDTMKTYAKMGITDAELSFELNLNKISDISRPVPTGIVAYGYLPLMTMRNCPVDAAIGCDNCKGWNKIIDRKDVEFFVNCDGGLSKIYNSVPLYLAERYNELKGLNFITLYFTKESTSECENILNAYMTKSAYDGNITRGLYYRNVL
ncbi:MAG: DUF3656 domain-containing protein [Oscillospiraceae bacterium]